MVPRAYQYQSLKPACPSTLTEKDDIAIVVRKQVSKTGKSKDTTSGDCKPAWLSSPTAATPSKPVVIPTRTRDGGLGRNKKGPAQGRRPLEGDMSHNPESVNSSVAALLAMTSVSEPKRQSPNSRGFRYASNVKRNKGKDHGRFGCSMSTSSPRSWDILRSPPAELDPENSSAGSDTTLGVGPFLRSLSMESMPSLDDDCGSLTSASNSIPSTPEVSVKSRNSYERKLSPSTTEDCLLDHPLLSLPSFDEPKSDDEAEVPVTTRRELPRSTSALKSNLSASIALIRFAARSFTNFTAPAISRDEYLTRSLVSLTPPFTDERRPPSTQDPPDPALRRYLNPINASPSELHIHHDHLHYPSSNDRCTASIQLQSYKRAPRPSDKASAPPIFASSKEKADAVMAAAAEEPFSTPSPRQRESRENSDFLRVIVLEMNMRRSGRLEDGVPGKARMALPARQSSRKDERGAGESEVLEGSIPRRWVAVGAY